MAARNLADLRIVGGHPALDLANTVEPRPPARVEFDYLTAPDALLRWALLTGVVTGAEAEGVRAAWADRPGAAEAALTDVLALRALIDPVLSGAELDTLTRRWATAIGRSTLAPTGTGAATLTVGTEPAWMIGDRLADALVDLVRDADRTRLRSCPLADGGCGWIFLDRSRNGTRRWCSMDDCGTHAKSRRLTERRRSRR